MTMFNVMATDPAEVQEFFGFGPQGTPVATDPVQIWRKPKGMRFSGWFLVGAGGAGGAGHTKASGTNGGGGGGAGSGGIVRAIFLNEYLPDELYLWLPAGGLGGTGAGGTGGRAFVGFDNTSIAATSLLLSSSAAGAQGGGLGTLTVVGALGAAATVSTIAVAIWANTAISWLPQAGSVGVAAGAVAGAVGTSKTMDLIVTGGAGGGSCNTTNFAGGSMNGIASIAPTSVAGTAAGGRGDSGVSNIFSHGLLFGTGGAGGGSFAAGTGGRGGDGGVGSGGGGGGSGTTGGMGGNGGPSYCRVSCW